MIGKLFKSKINSEVFRVDDEYKDNSSEGYVVRHIKSGKCSRVEKGWFLHGLMKNLEVVENTSHGERRASQTGVLCAGV